MDTADESKWIRPASIIDLFFEHGQKLGMVVTSYWLTLRTTAPLEGRTVKEALIHLYRKVPTLRKCLRERDGGTLWWREMDSEEIDFQVLKEADPLETLELTIGRSFESSKGPMWRATFIPAPDPNCPMTELHHNFPYCSSIVFGNHHGIADGTTNMKIVNMFLQILDDVLGGKTIKYDEQLGEHTSDEETNKLLDAKKSELEQDPELLQSLLESMKEREASASPLFLKAYPPPQDEARKNLVIPFDLDKETTKRFLSRCKAEGVTVNSGFISLVNVSTIDMLQKAGLKQESCQLKAMHAINVRRYWPGYTEQALGAHIVVLNQSIETPAKWKEDFWGYARKLHQDFHKELKEQGTIRDTCLELMEATSDSIENYFDESVLPTADYESSNMRNIDNIITTNGDHVRISRLVRSTSHSRNFMLHMFQTLRGHFLYSITYNTQYVTQDCAQELVDQIFSNLKSVC